MVTAYIIKNSRFAYRERDEEQKKRESSNASLLTSAVGDANMITHWVYFAYAANSYHGSNKNDDVNSAFFWWPARFLQLLSCTSGTILWLTIASDGRFLHLIWQALWKIVRLLKPVIRTFYSIMSKVVCCLSFCQVEFSYAAFDRKLDMWDTFFEEGFRIFLPKVIFFGILMGDILQVAITILIENWIGQGVSIIVCVNMTITVFDIFHKLVEDCDARDLYLETSPEILYIRTGTGARTLVGHKGEVSSLVVMRQDGLLVASASNDGKIKLWDLEDFSLNKSIATVDLKDSELNITRLGNDEIVTTSSDPGGEIKIYDFKDPTPYSGARLIDRHSVIDYSNEEARYGAVRCTTGSSSGEFFLTSKLENKKTILGTKGGDELKLGSKFLPADSNEVTKWNAATLDPEQRYPIRADFLVILDNDQHFVSANSRKGQEGHPTLWDIASGEKLRYFNIANQESRVTAMCKHSDDDSLFLVASYNQEDNVAFVDVFKEDLEDSVETMKIEGYGISHITSIGGHRFVYSNNHQAHLCDISSESCLHTFIGHRMGINALVYLPKKKSIATASCDRTIKVWPIPNHDGDERRPLLDDPLLGNDDTQGKSDNYDLEKQGSGLKK